MKKLAALLVCTIGLAACGADDTKRIVYVDSDTGRPLSAADVNRNKPIPTLEVGVVCLGNVLYYRDASYRRSALTPVMVPSTTVSIHSSNELTQVYVGEKLHEVVGKSLKGTDVTYVNLVGVRCP